MKQALDKNHGMYCFILINFDSWIRSYRQYHQTFFARAWRTEFWKMDCHQLCVRRTQCTHNSHFASITVNSISPYSTLTIITSSVEAELLLSMINQWNFDIFKLAEITEGSFSTLSFISKSLLIRSTIVLYGTRTIQTSRFVKKVQH